MEKAIVWGAGGMGQLAYNEIKKRYEIIAYIDSDQRKWGDTVYGIKIYSPDDINLFECDYFFIATVPGLEFARQVLLDKGVDIGRIITTYAEFPTQSRNTFLRNVSSLINEREIPGAVAEAGVYKGDFAKYINEYFPQRDLYLFDTFNGFDRNDMDFELAHKLSRQNSNDFSDTSVKLVLSKMPFPERVIVRKGLFPDTFKDVDEKFCFVNLDMDLYQPILAGLELFWDKMEQGGVITIHDYFNPAYQGVKKAVDEFCESRQSRLYPIPVGDGISVSLIRT